MTGFFKGEEKKQKVPVEESLDDEMPFAKEINLEPREHEIKFGDDFLSQVKEHLCKYRSLMDGDIIHINILGQSIPIRVSHTYPKGPVRVNEETTVYLANCPSACSKFLNAEDQALRLKNKPDLSKLKELADLTSLGKLLGQGLIEKYQDDKETIYIINGYFFREEKEKTL
jgi:hypothetical protein